MVEDIDTWFREKYKDVKPLEGATINTESPAWAIDRLSILAVKIYHMRAEAEREDATAGHREKCAAKLAVLLEQRTEVLRGVGLTVGPTLTEVGRVEANELLGDAGCVFERLGHSHHRTRCIRLANVTSRSCYSRTSVVLKSGNRHCARMAEMADALA